MQPYLNNFGVCVERLESFEGLWGLSRTPTPFLRRDAPSPPFQVRMPQNHGGAPPYAPVDACMDHSRETTISVLSQTITPKLLQPRLASAQLTSCGKKEGLCLNELDAAVLSRWKPPGCTPQISLDLALEQCRARACSQPHVLEPTATAGGGRWRGLCSRPTAGATTPHTKAALGGCPRLF